MQELVNLIFVPSFSYSDYSASKTRVVVIQAESDQPQQYNAVMSCIFSSQKAGIVVDSCCLGETSLFMQQAAFLTDGLYLNVQEVGLLQVVYLTYGSNPCLSTLTPHSMSYLLQHLLMTFLASQNVRSLLRLPKQNHQLLRCMFLPSRNYRHGLDLLRESQCGLQIFTGM